MLQQIISEYNGRDSSTTANVPQEPTRGESYQPGRYEGSINLNNILKLVLQK